jgi:hypothetical protein
LTFVLAVANSGSGTAMLLVSVADRSAPVSGDNVGDRRIQIADLSV